MVLVPLHCLILNLRDLILDQGKDCVQDLQLHCLVTLKRTWILSDLCHQVIETHEPIGVVLVVKEWA